MSEELPAWSLSAEAAESIALPEEWPGGITREWAWGGATGGGARVCVLDSGREMDHPLDGQAQRSVVLSIEGAAVLGEDNKADGDLSGSGTGCAAAVRCPPRD